MLRVTLSADMTFREMTGIMASSQAVKKLLQRRSRFSQRLQGTGLSTYRFFTQCGLARGTARLGAPGLGG